MTCQFLTYILAAHCTSHAILQSGSCAIYTPSDTALVELDHKESTVEIRRIVYIVVEDRPFHVAEVDTSGMLHCNQRLMLYSWRTVDLVLLFPDSIKRRVMPLQVRERERVPGPPKYIAAANLPLFPTSDHRHVIVLDHKRDLVSSVLLMIA